MSNEKSEKKEKKPAATKKPSPKKKAKKKAAAPKEERPKRIPKERPKKLPMVIAPLQGEAIGTITDEFDPHLKEHIVRLIQLYFVYLVTKKYRGKSTVISQKDVKNEAVRIIRLLANAAELEHRALRTFKTADHVIEYLRKVTGLLNVENWLNDRPLRRIMILKQSGLDLKYRTLFELSKRTSNGEVFVKIEAFKEAVAEMFGWMKIVDLLICNPTTSGAFRLMFDHLDFPQWSQDRVFAQICIAFTLDLHKNEFTLDELNLFFDKVSTSYIGWKNGLRAKLAQVVGQETTDIIFEQKRMKTLMKDLGNPINQNVFYFTQRGSINNRYVSLSLSDTKVLGSLAKAFQNAVRHASIRALKLTSSESIATTLSYKWINSFLSERRVEEVYDAVRANHHLLVWFNEEHCLRMIVHDSAQGYALKNELSGRFLSLYTSYLKQFSEKVSPIDVVKSYWETGKVFGVSLNILTREKTAKEKATKMGPRVYLKTFMQFICQAIPIKELREWFEMLEEEKIAIEPSLVPNHISLVLALSSKENPAIVATCLEKLTFKRFLGKDNVQKLFKIKVMNAIPSSFVSNITDAEIVGEKTE
ncbi:MAG: hypothetical protein JWM20_46 [Patescibacteria group bacterium]|nr:hypothetical protein [Patescibacteria group bacterium]